MESQHLRFVKALDITLSVLNRRKSEGKKPFWARLLSDKLGEFNVHDFDWLNFMYVSVAQDFGIDYLHLNESYPMMDVLTLYASNEIRNAYEDK